MNNKKTLSMVMTGLFMAIIAVMTFIPNVGYINLIVIKATLLHVPVIVGSIVLGPKKGAVLGATGFWAGIMIPAFLIQRNFALIVVGSFQQRTGCTHCKSYITASDRQ